METPEEGTRAEISFPDAIVSVLWKGFLPCSELEVHWSENDAEKPAALVRAEQVYWQSFLNAHPEVHLFNGVLAGLNGFRFHLGRLVLDLVPTDYRALVYANAHPNELKEKVGPQFHGQALGISAVVKTRDGQLVVMKRSTFVGEYPNRLDVFGGHVEPGKHGRKGKPDPCAGIRAELVEELHVAEGDIGPLRILGLLQNREIQKPELVFFAPILLDAGELLVQTQKAKDRFEWSELLLVPDKKVAIRSFLQDNFRDFTPSGLGCFLLYLD